MLYEVITLQLQAGRFDPREPAVEGRRIGQRCIAGLRGSLRRSAGEEQGRHA